MLAIYKITNKVNGKSYIGMTNNFSRRMREHKRRSNPSTRISKAIQSYGVDNFTYDILDYGGEELERYYIKYFDTLYPNGYNETPGGISLKGADNPRYGKSCTPETREKIRQKRLGSVLSDEHRRKISESGKGRVMSEHSRRLISEKNKEKGRARSDISKALIISLLEDRNNGMTYDELQSKYKISRGSVQRILKGEHFLLREGVEIG